MNLLQLINRVLTVWLVCTLGIATQAVAASKLKALPNTITTSKGKTYNAVRLVSTDPEGLVIQYKPQGGGLGLTKVKFENLPERLRQDYNYDPEAAAQFKSARQKATAEWKDRFLASERQEPAKQEVEPPARAAQTPTTGREEFPVDRFRATGTIRGAMILDTVTGEAWLLDLHSVLDDYKDRGYFLNPKASLPGLRAGQPVVFGP